MFFMKVNVEANKDMFDCLRKILDIKGADREEVVKKVNARLSEANDEEKVMMFCTDIKKETLSAVAAYIEPSVVQSCRKFMRNIFEGILQCKLAISVEEITTKRFVKKLEIAQRMCYLSDNRHNIENALNIDYFNNHFYDVKQEIISTRNMAHAEAKHRAEILMSSSTMNDEIGRIYSLENPKDFMGHPVHYRIICSEPEAGCKMADLIVKCLLANGRLVGRRIDKISKVKEGCYDETDFIHLIENAHGNTVLIDTRGEYDYSEGSFASAYENVINFFDGLIKKHNDDVLFVFLEDFEHPGFSKELIARVEAYLDIVEIEEGTGNKKAARMYMAELVSESRMSEYADYAKENIRYKKEEYTASELHEIFNQWRKDCLKQWVYKSYADIKKKKPEIKPKKKGRGELADLIGLDYVKNIVEQILAANIVDKRRRQATSKNFVMSKHMIFTGNPGTAKTTVARIIADTLKDEGVLKKGTFIECGRADLVGQYVGWTAVKVREAFRKAKGGVLFIDEAYALVDDSNSFGDEAINTIVQEMENYREDILVIFAGYPEKMESFLEKNDGLRSRIAFHVDFPDYSVDDLMKIFDKMMREKEYRMTKNAREKVREILEEGSGQPNFGNGRFVRNVLEQAILKQSVRLHEKFKRKEIPRKDLLVIKKRDVELPCVMNREQKKQAIGFCM